MLVRMRYVTKRVKAKGRIIWYWQRPGHKLVRLSDNEVVRFREAERLNRRADQAKKGGTGFDLNSVGWLVREYRDSDGFKAKAPATQKAYGIWLKRYEAEWGDIQAAEIDFPMVHDFAKGLNDRPATRELAIGVLNNLLDLARHLRLITENPTRDLRLEASPIRSQVWGDDQVTALLAAADAHDEGPALRLGIALLLYTAQRPGDVLAMTWARWSVDGIEVRQEKTKAFLRIWCHSDLSAQLKAAKAKAKGTHIVTDRQGRPVSTLRFRNWYDAICVKAEIRDMQIRDFRRTAVVKLAQAGCTVPEIASVTGHTLKNAETILRTYLPRTPEMTKLAIKKLERASNKKSAAEARKGTTRERI